MTRCAYCGGEIDEAKERRKRSVMRNGHLRRVHIVCTDVKPLPNVFRELGFPDAKRDRSQPKGSYVWY